MDAMDVLSRRFVRLILGLSIGAIAGYPSWLIVPEVVKTVLPAVIRALPGAQPALAFRVLPDGCIAVSRNGTIPMILSSRSLVLGVKIRRKGIKLVYGCGLQHPRELGA